MTLLRSAQTSILFLRAVKQISWSEHRAGHSFFRCSRSLSISVTGLCSKRYTSRHQAVAEHSE